MFKVIDAMALSEGEIKVVGSSRFEPHVCSYRHGALLFRPYRWFWERGRGRGCMTSPFLIARETLQLPATVNPKRKMLRHC